MTTATQTAITASDAWRYIEQLSPAEKAKLTRRANKLRAEVGEKNRPIHERAMQLSESFYAKRDAIVAEALAHRDAIIKAANAQFESISNRAYEDARQATVHFHTEANDKVNANWKEHDIAWKQLVSEVLGMEVK